MALSLKFKENIARDIMEKLQRFRMVCTLTFGGHLWSDHYLVNRHFHQPRLGTGAVECHAPNLCLGNGGEYTGTVFALLAVCLRYHTAKPHRVLCPYRKMKQLTPVL